MTALRPALGIELDELTPADLIDLHPALASLLRSAERTQRSLLTGYGTHTAAVSVAWLGPEEEGANYYRYPVRVPPGVRRIAFRLLGFSWLVSGAEGQVTIFLDDGTEAPTTSTAEDYTIVLFPPTPANFPARLLVSSWRQSSLNEEMAGSQLAGAKSIKLSPALEWRTVDFMVRVPEHAGVFCAEPIFAFDDIKAELDIFNDPGPFAAQTAWSLGRSCRGVPGSPGIPAGTAYRNYDLSAPRTTIVWFRMDDDPNSAQTLLAYGDNDAVRVLQLALTEDDVGGAIANTGPSVTRFVGGTGIPNGPTSAWHQLILTWRANSTAVGTMYLDGAAMSGASNMIGTAYDGSNLYDIAYYLAAHFNGADTDPILDTTYVAEIAEMSAWVTTQMVTELWNGGVPKDLRKTTYGRFITDYWTATASDIDPDTQRRRYYNLGHEPKWQFSIPASPEPLNVPYYPGELIPPSFNGSVFAAALDGQGGAFFGGSFTEVTDRVTTYTRTRLCHVDSTGLVTAWNPTADGTVSTLEYLHGHLYVAGNFSNCGGQAHADFTRLDPLTGAADPDFYEGVSGGGPGSRVLCIAAPWEGSTDILVGGFFTSIHGTARGGLARITDDGEVTSWAADLAGTGSAGAFRISVVNEGIYVGGLFETIGGETRGNVAKLSRSGSVLAWAPTVSNPPLEIVEAGDYVYLGFEEGLTLSRYNKTNDATRDWAWSDEVEMADQYVDRIVVRDGRVYVFGGFTDHGPNSVCFDEDTAATITAWDLEPNGRVHEVRELRRGVLLVVGQFTATGDTLTRNRAQRIALLGA